MRRSAEGHIISGVCGAFRSIQSRGPAVETPVRQGRSRERAPERPKSLGTEQEASPHTSTPARPRSESRQRGKREATDVVPGLRGMKPMNERGKRAMKLRERQRATQIEGGGDPSRECGGHDGRP